MKSGYDATARTRPVNLTLNEDLVSHANLSATVPVGVPTGRRL